MARDNEAWLPTDLLIEILMKFPVKSIIRFLYVKKPWFHLFQKPIFISQHHNICKKNTRLLVYYTPCSSENFAEMRLFVDQVLVSYQDIQKQLPTHFANIFSWYFCVDNGLFCLCDHGNHITLCNPATREFRILPEYFPRDYYPTNQCLGFGLDPLSNNYKVVFIRMYYDEENDLRETYHYAIYKMSTDSWKVLNNEDLQLPEHLSSFSDENNACVNAVCYWHASSKILAFYLGNEVFRLIELPCPETYRRLFPLHDFITIWDTHMLERMEKSYNVRLLNDEGRWIKLLKIEPILGVGLMTGFWKNGKILVESITGKLVLYHLETKDFDEIRIKLRNWRNLLHVYTYEESLVKIKRD